jgi:hypothetical protein
MKLTGCRRLEPWRELTHYAWVQCREKKLVKAKPCLFQIHLPFTDVRRRDPHNYSSTVQKAVIDALVDKYEKAPTGETVRVWEGCWPDDTPEWVKTLEPILYKGTKCVIEISPL